MSLYTWYYEGMLFILNYMFSQKNWDGLRWLQPVDIMVFSFLSSAWLLNPLYVRKFPDAGHNIALYLWLYGLGRLFAQGRTPCHGQVHLIPKYSQETRYGPNGFMVQTGLLGPMPTWGKKYQRRPTALKLNVLKPNFESRKRNFDPISRTAWQATKTSSLPQRAGKRRGFREVNIRWYSQNFLLLDQEYGRVRDIDGEGGPVNSPICFDFANLSSTYSLISQNVTIAMPNLERNFRVLTVAINSWTVVLGPWKWVASQCSEG